MGCHTNRLPWDEREYTVNRSGVRSKALVDGGLPQNRQYTVTMPPELAVPWYEAGAAFRWIKVDDDLYALQRLPGARKSHPADWSKDEVALLDEGRSTDEIMRITGRSRQAVNMKRYLLRAERGLIDR